LIAVVRLVLLAVGVALILRSRRAKITQLEGLSDAQRHTLEDFEAQVLALLFQHGSQLDQVEMAAALVLPAERVAEKLLAMKAEGLIERQWTVEEYNHSVRCKS
jgi:hypothetical protein